MGPEHKSLFSLAIIKKGEEFGASLVGLVSVSELKKEYVNRMSSVLPSDLLSFQKNTIGLSPIEVQWPDDGQTVVILGLEHPETQMELDWWYGSKDPLGNRILRKIVSEFKIWMKIDYNNVAVYPLSYHLEKGGIFLKDAASLAGLGTIGRNNLLVTPQYGPRIRLRAFIISEKLSSTGPREFDPCTNCETDCLKHCPGSAFSQTEFSTTVTNEKFLLDRSKIYSRIRCNSIMHQNVNAAKKQLIPEISPNPVSVIKYCRNCEIYCKVKFDK